MSSRFDQKGLLKIYIYKILLTRMCGQVHFESLWTQEAHVALWVSAGTGHLMVRVGLFL